MNLSVHNYKKAAVEANDSLNLVVMLYEGAVNFLEQAKHRMKGKQHAEKGILITKVLAILAELQGSLNMNEGGEVASYLDRLYAYMTTRLMDANSGNDTDILDEVLAHLRTLKNAWCNIEAKQQSRQPREEVDRQLTPIANANENNDSGQTIAIEVIG